jgi:CheY-like chemotaxis protein
MEELAVQPQEALPTQQPAVQVLLADDDAPLRSLFAASVRDRSPVAVLEAGDGAEAIQLGLQHRPQIGLIDVTMPRLGGIEVALTLRTLVPEIRLALHTADSHAHRESARAHRLPLFDKLRIDGMLAWLDVQARACACAPEPPRARSLSCVVCGCGIVSAAPPASCPMCREEAAWIPAAEAARLRRV